MAVVSVGEIWSGRRGKTTREWANEYDRVFMVETNSATDSAQTVTGAGAIALGLPKRGDVHNEDTLAACIDVSASNSSDDPREWHVTCSYSTDLSSFSTDPTDDPIQFKWATEWKDSGTLRDLDDEAILSSSYEPFDPPAPIHRPIDVITATMIRDNFDHATQIQAFRGKVNTSEFVLDGETCPAKSLLCYDVVADMVEKKGAWYRQFTYTFKRDLEGSDPWQYYPLDLGFYEWDDTNDRFTPISQSNGQPIAHPVLLDGAGNRLNMADTPQPAPVNLAFRIREDVNFATIFAA
jgi:hypothetical protein